MHLPPPSLREEGQGGGCLLEAPSSIRRQALIRKGLVLASDSAMVGWQQEMAPSPLIHPRKAGGGLGKPSSLVEGGGSGWRVFFIGSKL